MDLKEEKTPDVEDKSLSNHMKTCSLCHTSKTPLWRGGPSGPKSLCNACGIKESAAESSLQCSTCRKTYSGNETHLDLTITGGQNVYGESKAVSTELSRFPFGSCTVDAVHAGAALHCWPSPSAAVAEISSVLKPGGIFVATTFILDGPLSYVPYCRPLRQSIAQLLGSHIFLSEQELEDICTACGHANFTCTRNRSFVMTSAAKPK